MRGVAIFAVFLLAALPVAADKPKFEAKSAEGYPAKQSQKDVTVAVKPFVSDAEMKRAFDDVKPYKHGVTPVLLVISNAGDHPLGLEDLKVRFITAGREGIDAIPAEDLQYYKPKGHKPKGRPPYIPPVPGTGSVFGKGKKGPLAKWSIQEREFKAPVVPPRTSVSGFFYYLTGNEPDPIPGAAIYITGIRDLKTGKELFYFEIPLDPYAD